MRPEVKAFAEEMEKQLKANEEKGGWKSSHPAGLFGELRNHVEALRRTVFKGVEEPVWQRRGEIDKAKVIDDAADIANFALMVADVCGALPTSNDEKPEASDFMLFAKNELILAGLFRKDSDYAGMLGNDVLKMCEQFEEKGYSGCSAEAAVSIFSRLARCKTLTPIKHPIRGDWIDIGGVGGIEGDTIHPRPIYQHKREGALFSEDEGKTWYWNKPVPVRFVWWKPWTWREPHFSGVCRYKRQRISFPWMPPD